MADQSRLTPEIRGSNLVQWLAMLTLDKEVTGSKNAETTFGFWASRA